MKSCYVMYYRPGLHKEKKSDCPAPGVMFPVRFGLPVQSICCNIILIIKISPYCFYRAK